MTIFCQISPRVLNNDWSFLNKRWLIELLGNCTHTKFASATRPKRNRNTAVKFPWWLLAETRRSSIPGRGRRLARQANCASRSPPRQKIAERQKLLYHLTAVSHRGSAVSNESHSQMAGPLAVVDGPKPKDFSASDNRPGQDASGQPRRGLSCGHDFE